MARLIGKVGNKKFWDGLIGLTPIISKKINRRLHNIGAEHVRTVHDLMQEKKTGQLYKIRGTEHQSSAPGEAPAIRTGFLFRSVYYKVRGIRQIEIGATVPYSGFLEDGTSKMEPRPYLKAAADKEQRNTVKAVIDWNL